MTINYENLNNCKSNIKKFDRSRLLIVTKNQSLDDIEELIHSGYRMFGENRVQEAKLKYSSLNNFEDISLHLIGPLQTNKVKEALMLFDTIESIDRKKLVDEIFKVTNKSPKIKTKNFYIQINIGSEDQKFGVDKSEVFELYEHAISKNLSIEGFMCIPPNTNSPEKYFQEMNLIRDSLDKGLKLSMGMSNDYLLALKNNSNIVRIGSLIFND